MVWLALVFLGVMAIAIPHSFITMPADLAADDGAAVAATDGAGVDEAAAMPASPGAASGWLSLSPFERATLVNNFAVGALVLLAIPFWIELLVRLAYVERGDAMRPSRTRVLYMICCALVPPLRTGLPPATLAGRMWLPFFGWRHASRPLARRVQRTLGVPMLAIGLLILPVLLVEILLKDQAQRSPGLAFGLDTATRVIWFALALEFIVMMAVTRRKMEYAFRHWVDLVIILLPFVAFLRTLRLLRAGQLLKAHRLSQLARTYRLRGVAVKLLQAVLLLRVLEGISERAARRRITGLREQIHRRNIEIQELREEMTTLRRELAQRKRKRRSTRRAARQPQAPAAPALEAGAVTPGAASGG